MDDFGEFVSVRTGGNESGGGVGEVVRDVCESESTIFAGATCTDELDEQLPISLSFLMLSDIL